MDESHKALLIVDMQRDFIDDGAPLHVPDAKNIIESIAGEIRYAREKKRPIIYVCDRHAPDDPEFEYWPPHSVRGTPGAEIIDTLAPQPGDHIVEKAAYSGFFKTNLESLLDELEIDEVLICGVLTNICVLYTAMDALQRGIRVIVPEPCVAGVDPDDHKFALRQITEVLKAVHRD
jgi:nicotinamidase-related amidase